MRARLYNCLLIACALAAAAVAGCKRDPNAGLEEVLRYTPADTAFVIDARLSRLSRSALMHRLYREVVSREIAIEGAVARIQEACPFALADIKDATLAVGKESSQSVLVLRGPFEERQLSSCIPQALGASTALQVGRHTAFSIEIGGRALFMAVPEPEWLVISRTRAWLQSALEAPAGTPTPIARQLASRQRRAVSFAGSLPARFGRIARLQPGELNSVEGSLRFQDPFRGEAELRFGQVGAATGFANYLRAERQGLKLGDNKGLSQLADKMVIEQQQEKLSLRMEITNRQLARALSVLDSSGS